MKRKLLLFWLFLSVMVFGISVTAFSDGCLTFTGESEPFTLSGKHLNWTGTLEYSTDLSTWTIWDGSEIASSQSAPFVLYLRGEGNDYVRGEFIKNEDYYDGGDGKYYGFQLSARSSCSGNIMTLLDYSGSSLKELPWAGPFQGLFGQCNNLTSAPTLPDTTLISYCYASMFSGCTSLTSAPALPATVLADRCYFNMFSGCTSLTSAPTLPATTLRSESESGSQWSYCYYGMFKGCTSLTSAPALPATIMADNCYASMFAGCTSLTSAPALPATIMADNCYASMFAGCTSLTSAPALPATIMADLCYASMFAGCTSLTSAPALSATTLAEYCYEYMFSGCTSLTSPPALPATGLKRGCYMGMFTRCTGIRISEIKETFSVITINDIVYDKEYRIPTEGSGYNDDYSCFMMFDETGGKFTGTPQINKKYYLGRIVTDQDIANYVIEKINAIGTVSYTNESKSLIDTARTAYDGLTDAQKALVTNYATLTDAEAEYERLKGEAEQAAADDVIAKIGAIGTVEYNSDSKARINAARQAYDGLTATQKDLVSNYSSLTTAEIRYADLKRAAEDQPNTGNQTGGDSQPSAGSQTESPTPAIVQEPITIEKAPASVKVKVKKNKVTVDWKKIKKTKKTKKLLGKIKFVQVQYSTDPSFKERVINKRLGKKKTKATLRLEKKTIYYIRVRYVGKDGVSKWSKKKKVKTK